MTLKFPFRDLTLARANYDFTPDQKESNMLSFRSGEVLAVIDRMGDNVGWWKAIKENRIGYIPRDFVSPLEANTQESMLDVVRRSTFKKCCLCMSIPLDVTERPQGKANK